MWLLPLSGLGPKEEILVDGRRIQGPPVEECGHAFPEPLIFLALRPVTRRAPLEHAEALRRFWAAR
jgi:hypothetical protein